MTTKSLDKAANRVYRDRLKGMQILLSRTQARACRTGKQEKVPGMNGCNGPAQLAGPANQTPSLQLEPYYYCCESNLPQSVTKTAARVEKPRRFDDVSHTWAPKDILGLDENTVITGFIRK